MKTKRTKVNWSVIGFSRPVNRTGSPKDDQTLSPANAYFKTSLIIIQTPSQVKFSKSIPHTNITKHEYIHKHHKQIFEELVPSLLKTFLFF